MEATTSSVVLTSPTRKLASALPPITEAGAIGATNRRSSVPLLPLLQQPAHAELHREEQEEHRHADREERRLRRHLVRRVDDADAGRAPSPPEHGRPERDRPPPVSRPWPPTPPIASSCEPNDRAKDTSTSDPTLESGDPITRSVAASPDCTCAENPSGNTTPPSMSPSSASRSTCAGESASRSVTKSRLVQHVGERRGDVAARVEVDDGVGRLEALGLDVPERQPEDPREPEGKHEGHEERGAVAEAPPEILRRDRPGVTHRATPRRARLCR